MKKYRLWAFMGMALCAPSAFAATLEYKDSGASGITVKKNSDGRTVETIRTVAYEVARDYDSNPVYPVLLKEVTQTETVVGLEGSKGNLELTARGTGRKAFDTVLYKKSEQAHGAAFAGDGLLLPIRASSALPAFSRPIPPATSSRASWMACRRSRPCSTPARKE